MSDPTPQGGGCHCKKVRYEVTVAAGPAIGCNCSMCAKKGSLLSFVAPEAFVLKSGEDNLTDYQFNKHNIHHMFCKTCGVTSFATGKKRDGTSMVAINVRCLDAFDLDAVEVKMVDGKSA